MRTVMVVAGGRIIFREGASKQGADSVIGCTRAASVDVDAGFREGVFRAHAHAAAEQRVNAPVLEKTGESAVALTFRVFDLCGRDRAFLDIVDLESLCFAKVLENLPVGAVRDGEFHCVFAPFLCENAGTSMAQARSAAAVLAWRRARLVAAARDGKRQAADESMRDFLTGTRIHRLHRRARDIHRICAGRLVDAFVVDEAEAFVFVERQEDGSVCGRRNFGSCDRRERGAGRHHTDAAGLGGSSHGELLL